jgi:hypothetical protein
VAYVDGYGNLKTTWTQPPAPLGQEIQITIGDKTATATSELTSP